MTYSFINSIKVIGIWEAFQYQILFSNQPSQFLRKILFVILTFLIDHATNKTSKTIRRLVIVQNMVKQTTIYN